MTIERSMEVDLVSSDWIREKARADDSYAQNLYAAMCNNEFESLSTGRAWSCSWRSAGGVVADVLDQGGDYLDWYCSGIWKDIGEPRVSESRYVEEGVVTDEVRADLEKLGWRVSN